MKPVYLTPIVGVLAVIGGLLSSGFGTRVQAQAADAHQVTFTKDVAPILQRACQNLVSAANTAGGPDNISVVLAQLIG